MSQPPFTMSKYANETDLLRDKCAWLERELAEANICEEGNFRRAEHNLARAEAACAYAGLSREALKLTKAWIERESGDGELLEDQMRREAEYVAKHPGKTFWTADYSAMCSAVIAALAKNPTMHAAGGQVRGGDSGLTGSFFAIALHSDGTSTDMLAPYCKDCGSNDIQQPDVPRTVQQQEKP